MMREPTTPPGTPEDWSRARRTRFAWLRPNAPVAWVRVDDPMDLQQAVNALTPTLVELLESHGALLDWIARQGVRPNWAQDRATLEAAQALQARLSPEGPDDARHPSPDPAR